MTEIGDFDKPRQPCEPPRHAAFEPDSAAAEPRLWLWLLAAALFLAGWGLYALPWLLGLVTIPWDAKAHFLPQLQFLASSLWRGDWPFWTPHVFAGHPQIADPQSQMFSPPMLALALVNGAPGNHAIDVTVLLCVAAAGLGVMLLFRDLKWHPAGGLVAALGFAMGAAMAWRLQHYGQVLSLAYLPFALVCLRRALLTGSAWYGAGAGILAGFIVNGRDQVALLEVYLLAGLVVTHLLAAGLAQVPDRLKRATKPLIAGTMAGAAVCVIPVVLTALLAAHSNRPEIDLQAAGQGSLHPALLLTAAAPHLFGAAGEMADYWGPPSFAWPGTDLFIAQNMGLSYIGAIPLVLLITGVVRGQLMAREVRFFSIALVLALLYALGRYTPAFAVFYELLPGVGYYRRPADAMFLVGGLAALVAGYAAHRLVQPAPDRLDRHLLASVGGIVALILVTAAATAAGRDRLPQAALPLAASALWLTLALATIGLAIRLLPVRPMAAMAMIGLATAADLAINNGPNGATGLPPELTAVLEPDTDDATIGLLQARVAATRSATRRDRVELAGLGFHWPNASLTHGLDNTLGYNPVRLGYYSRATGAQDHVGLPSQRTFSPLFPSYRSLMADLLGLRFIATGVPIETIDKRLPPGSMRLIARTRHGYVYENPQALPRVLFATRALLADFEQLLRDGRWPAFDPTRTVLLDRPPDGAPPSTVTTAASGDTADIKATGHVRIERYRNTEIEIAVDSPRGGWVVLNDVWHPWWFAQVDGRPATIQRANVVFRAVKVPAGPHRVVMTFRPLKGALQSLLADRR